MDLRNRAIVRPLLVILRDITCESHLLPDTFGHLLTSYTFIAIMHRTAIRRQTRRMLMRYSRYIVAMFIVVLFAGGVFGSDSNSTEKDLRYEDTGCIRLGESHGCHDSGSSSLCWQEAEYARYGLPGEIPLPLSVTVKAHCKYVHLWVQQCSDQETESGYGSISAEAECIIFQVFSGDCFTYPCWETCEEG